MFLKFFRLAGLALFIWTTGNAAAQTDAEKVDQRSLGSDLSTFQAPAQPPGDDESARPSFEEPTGVITLQQALSLALMRNPRLRTFAWEVRAREAKALQERLLPNPEISLEMEDFAGTGPFRRYDGAQTTLQLSQLIQLAGKRMKRAKVATLDRDLAAWDYETVRIKTLTEVAKAFIDILLAQEQTALANELAKLAKLAFETASERVRAGKAAPIDETKARVEFAVSRIERGKAARRLTAARKRLVALWASDEPMFDRAEGRLRTVSPIPSSQQVDSLISLNPDIARQEAEMKRIQAEVNLARAGRIPDLTIAGGPRRFSETGDNSYVVGISIPLPLFDRNQGAYQEARFRLAKAKEERRAAVARVRSAMADAYQALSTAYAEVSALVTDVLPGARIAFDVAWEGYRQGKFSFLEVLDAQRVLFKTRGEYIDALASYHKAVADVESLTGSSMDTIKNTVEDKSIGR